MPSRAVRTRRFAPWFVAGEKKASKRRKHWKKTLALMKFPEHYIKVALPLLRRCTMRPATAVLHQGHPLAPRRQAGCVKTKPMGLGAHCRSVGSALQSGLC